MSGIFFVAFRHSPAQVVARQKPPLFLELPAAERVEPIAVRQALAGRSPIDGKGRFAREEGPQRQHSALEQAVFGMLRLGPLHRLPQHDKLFRGRRRDGMPGEDENVQIAPAGPEIVRDRRAVQIHRRTAVCQQAADRVGHPLKRGFQKRHPLPDG